jgi:hypothetical protein
MYFLANNGDILRFSIDWFCTNSDENEVFVAAFVVFWSTLFEYQQNLSLAVSMIFVL